MGRCVLRKRRFGKEHRQNVHSSVSFLHHKDREPFSPASSSFGAMPTDGIPRTCLERFRGPLRLAFCASGICSSYWFYGFLQEKIVTESDLGATFILVLQTVVNIAIALIWQRVEGPPPGSAAGQQLNHPLLSATASTYVFAMVGSNEALRFVSYPTAVLAKSCKLIPTMAMGWAIEKRTYDLQQWTAALLISFGIAIFNLARIKDAPSSHDNGREDAHWKGMALLALSLGMDGFLGVGQGFLKRQDTRGKNERPPSAVETMLWMNIYALLLLIPMAVADNQWNKGIETLSQDAFLLKAMMLLNGVVGIGQIFIFLTITWYSSLICTTITTTRKFFTILFSVIHFGHHFSTWQWLSTGMVFSGLYLSIMVKKAPEKCLSKED